MTHHVTRRCVDIAVQDELRKAETKRERHVLYCSLEVTLARSANFLL
jgi:hypothetical protein